MHKMLNRLLLTWAFGMVFLNGIVLHFDHSFVYAVLGKWTDLGHISLRRPDTLSKKLI